MMAGEEEVEDRAVTSVDIEGVRWLSKLVEPLRGSSASSSNFGETLAIDC